MSQALVPLIYVLTFAAIMTTVVALADVLFLSRDQAERTNRRLTMLASGMKHSEVYAALVRRPISRPSSNAFVLRLYDHVALYYQQAGLQGSPLRMLPYVGVAAMGLWLVSFLSLRSGNFADLVLNATFVLPACFVISGLASWMWLGRKRTKRLKQLEEQMPLALDIINRAIRAGHPVISAVQLAGNEMGDPIGSEFGLIVDETTYGFEFREALTNFARRTGSQDAHFFAVSVGVQAETGGNLVEILEGLAAVIRSRSMLAKRIKALSSEGRASAILLSVLPAFLITFMMVFKPDYYTAKFPDPMFWPIASGVSVLYLVGLLLIRQIINFKY